MARKSLLYWLFSKDKKPLYVDEGGHVQEGDPGSYAKPNGQPAHVRKSPTGWKDTLIKYARNIKYWGLFRDFTVPMKFPIDGAKILRNRMWLFGVECVCYLAIMRLDRLNLPYNYENYYLSELNFSKYRETLTDVTVEALEGGLSKVFKANENTKYELGVETDAEHVNVINDGHESDYTRTFMMIPEQKAIDVDSYYLGVVETAREGNPGDDVLFQDLFPMSSSVYPNDDWLAKFKGAYDIVLTGKLKIRYAENITAIVRAEVNDGLTSGGTVQYDLFNQAGVVGEYKDALINQAISVPAGHRLHIKHTMFNPVASGEHYDIIEGELKISYVYRLATTYTRALYLYRAINQTVKKMSANAYSAVSEWLEPKKDIVLTSGDALRKIPGAIIKTTPGDFFQACKSLPADASGGGAGLGIDEDRLRIERFDYFFKDEMICDLGEVLKPDISVAEDLMFNTIACGQPPNDYTDANGRDEPNQDQGWTTPMTRIIRELNLLSPYRKDSLGIEQARRNFENKLTTDANTDNDGFLMNIETVATPIEATVRFVAAGNYMLAPSLLNFTIGEAINITGTAGNNGAQTVVTITPAAGGNQIELSNPVVDEADVLATLDFVDHPYFKLYRPAYTAITGIPHPESAYNTELSPKKALLSNGSLIRSAQHPMDTELLKLASSDKNKEQSTTLAGVTVTEKEDIQIGALPARKWLPYYINFTTKVPVNVLALIKAKPYGWVAFTVEGEPFKAYLFDGGTKPATQDAQVWKTLSHQDNDLSKFKRA